MVGKQGFMHSSSHHPSYQKTSVVCFSAYLWNRLSLFMFFKKKMTCFPHLRHISSHRGYIPEVQRGIFFLSITICHTDLSQLRKRQSSMHCQALNTVWIAPVSQEPAFHVSDFSQGALMLIHFILLTHLFFFRFSYLFWTFKYIYMQKKKLRLSLCTFWRETSMMNSCLTSLRLSFNHRRCWVIQDASTI